MFLHRAHCRISLQYSRMQAQCCKKMQIWAESRTSCHSTSKTTICAQRMIQPSLISVVDLESQSFMQRCKQTVIVRVSRLCQSGWAFVKIKSITLKKITETKLQSKKRRQRANKVLEKDRRSSKMLPPQPKHLISLILNKSRVWSDTAISWKLAVKNYNLSKNMQIISVTCEDN